MHILFGSRHGSLGEDGLAVLGDMELYLRLHDAFSVTLFYSYDVLKYGNWAVLQINYFVDIKETLECFGDWERVRGSNLFLLFPLAMARS